ncbi:hypothetical protein SKAU_G00260320 [Synaphobranchus kaupii]|uniref:Phospholipid/glycerol acyltransferase domain-containing protein n=1 Tax=Synaphobranchus kaupii TaxID=118154 RepID=A0A9Q1IST7_SYNKA|nr:hypothetical protein SKAU_G00260320 [Synaphobranchus kaupii]
MVKDRVNAAFKGTAPRGSIMGLFMYLKSLFILQLLISFVFVVSGLIINFIQLCTCIIWPFNKQLYRTINCRLSYSLWSQLVMLLEWWSCTDCTLYTDQATVDMFGKEHVIIILNHNYEIDFLCGWTMCERYGVLGSSKVLAKHELLKVPLIGWTWYFLEIVFCKRKWEEDRDKVFRGLERLKDYPEFMWFLLYCEGTRFTEKKHQISMQVAESKGLPKLKYHLLPRTKGFTTTLRCLKGTVTAVYDVTLNFKDKKIPTLLGIISGKKYKADMSIRRFTVEDIPDDEKECAAWLHKLYQEKDALQEHYEKEGLGSPLLIIGFLPLRHRSLCRGTASDWRHGGQEDRLQLWRPGGEEAELDGSQRYRAPRSPYGLPYGRRVPVTALFLFLEHKEAR